MNCNQKEQVAGTVCGESVTIYSSESIYNFSHIEGITLSAGEITGRACDMGLDEIGTVDNRASV